MNCMVIRLLSSYTPTNLCVYESCTSEVCLLPPSRLLTISSDTIRADKAAALVYLRMRHKDPYKGYVLCSVVSISAHVSP